MKSIFRIAIGLLLLLVQTVYAQPKTPVMDRVLSARSKGEAFSASGLFKRLGSADPQMQKVLKRGSFMALDKRIMAELRSKKPEHIIFDIAVDANQTITLELVKNEILAADFRVTTSGISLEKYQRDQSVHYQGIVHGPARSMAAISITGNEIMGVIDVDGIGNMILGPLENDPQDRYAFFRSEDLDHDMKFDCGTSELSAPAQQLQEQITLMSTDPNRCVRIYFECEYDMFIERGSVTNTVNYMTSIYNVVKTLYDNESVKTSISEIFVWNTQDNYPTTSPWDALMGFQTLRGSNYNGSVAILVSRGAPSGGGIAFLDVACTKSNSFAYCFINSSFQQYPTYSWTVMVIAHEMGHTLGSPHTHNCSWDVDGDGVAAEMIDGCAASIGVTEGSCPAGPMPTNGGTLMSYCHIAGPGINFNNGFGPLPGDRIRNRVYNATCLAACGSDGGGGATCQTTVSITGSNPTCPGGNNGSATANPSGGSSPYTYQWNTGATTATITGLTPGTYTVTVRDKSSTGCPVSASVTITAPPNWAVSEVITAESLPGAGNGAIDITVSGATSPYTFQWSNGSNSQDLVNIGAGTYSVTITDSRNCTTQRTYSVGSGSCAQQLTSFPVAESFESGLGIFSQAPNDNYDWIRQSGPTPNSNTGPSGAYQGAWYLFAQGKGNSGNANLESPCLDLRNLSSPQLLFAYSMNGTQVGTLRLEASTNNGGTWTTLWTRTGNQGTGTGWATETISLASVKTGFTRIRFVAVAGGNFGDIGIDDIRIQNESAPCVAPVLSFSKTDVSCFGGNNGSATVTASNGSSPYTYVWSNGATAATLNNLTAGNYNVVVTATGGCTASGSVSIGQPAALDAQLQSANTTGPGASDGSVITTISGGTAPYTYLWNTGATTKDLLNVRAGTYTLQVRDAKSCLVEKSATVIDGIPAGPTCSNGITLPHAESFENGTVHWIQSTADQFDWRRNSGGTPTANTGPSAAAEGQMYMYTEANDASSGARAILESSCLSLTNISNASLQFSWHMFGNQMGSLSLDITDDGGITWHSLWNRRGNNGNSWVTQTISLSAYTGKVVRFRFMGTLSNGVRGDMAIDNIRITGVGSAAQSDLITRAEKADFEWQKLYPNPTDGLVQLEVYAPEATIARTSLVDVTGRTIDMGPVLLNAGMNAVKLNLPARQQGMYLLRLLENGRLHVKSVLILK